VFIKKDEATAARRRVYLHLVDATDGITPETGEAAGQPQFSKNGAAFGNTSATLTSVGNGTYYVELTTGEVDTYGFLLVRYKSGNTAEAQEIRQVVDFDPYSAVTPASVVDAIAIKKNTALNAFTFPMRDANGDLKTGETITATRSIDGAAYASCANAAAEIGTTGTYKIDLAATDLNGTVIAFKMTSSGAKATTFTICTQDA